MDEARTGWRILEAPADPLAVGPSAPPGAAWSDSAGLARGGGAQETLADPRNGAGDPSRRDDGMPLVARLRESVPGIVPLVLATASGAVVAAAFVLALLGSGGEHVFVDPAPPGASAGSEGVAAADTAGTGPDGSGGPADPAAGATGAAGAILVDVEGGVARPGVVRLPAAARVGDAVAAAGGYGPTVDVERAASEVNLAARIQDGDRIWIPALGDPVAPAGPAARAVVSGDIGAGGGITAADAGTGGATGGAIAGSGAGAAGLVDLNHASAAELEALPGIGPATAAKILDARATAPFVAVSDLRDRKLVSASTYAKIQGLVAVGP
ncbi:MAG: helix-hairpin-helix domain-containing protein [Chloroflexi bacterium]|nr:helix-hairpin-helix domain-containing protein [Chloroflexota bacterium]